MLTGNTFLRHAVPSAITLSNREFVSILRLMDYFSSINRRLYDEDGSFP